MENLQKTGTVEFWLRNPAPNWMTDFQHHNFQAPDLSKYGLLLNVEKTKENHLQVSITGPNNHTFHFRKHLNSSIANKAKKTQFPDGLHVAITWDEKDVKFYLNAEMLQQREV